MVNGLARRAWGTAVVLGTLPKQRAVPYLPPERLVELRDARVRETVTYAFETVPYYRELAQTGKVDPGRIRTAEDLDRLPLLDREMVRADPVRFVSTSKRARNAVPFLTSGTTGTPLRVLYDRRSLLESIAHGERERVVESHFCGRRVRYTAVHISASMTAARVRTINMRSMLAPIRPNRMWISSTLPLDDLVSQFNRLRPHLIRAYGPYLEALFRVVDAQDIDMHLPRVAVYGSGVMTPEGKRLIEERFGIPVISRYNAIECFQIAFTCEERDGFHVHDDLCYLRIVGRDGQTLAPGQRGEVTISNLVNRATVLLNYRLGDFASIRGQQCPCGRTTTLLTPIDGRADDVLYLADGTIVGSHAVWNAVKDRPEILGYQLIQHEYDRFDLRLTMSNEEALEHVAGAVVADLAVVLGPSAVIKFERRDPAEPLPPGKFRPVVSQCGPAKR
jgi:phenylacetate-CoA ligase